MQRVLLVGLNHTTAPLSIRERVVFNGEGRERALREFGAKFPEAEAAIVSTCNRVELYVARSVHGHPRQEEMVEFLAGFHGMTGGDLNGHLYHKVELEAVRHLFSVSSSLDSMVLGETQILGQVREAYEAAAAAGAAREALHPLFQKAIAVGKQVMSETALAEGRLSVASVAVDYARRIFDHFHDKAVLSIGAGKMAVLVLQSFAALRPGRLMVCNRSAEKAQALAQRFGGEAAAFEKLSEHLVAADIVITSTGAMQPIITRGQFEQLVKLRRYRPIFLIDIALPRDVEASVGEMANVYLYNIDDLQGAVSATQAQRAGAVEAARKIVELEVSAFVSWSRTREMGPLIERLYKRYHAMAMEEAGRTANKLGMNEEERKQLEELARRVVNKLLHEPIQTLKESDALHGPGGQYLHAMEKLFGVGEGEDE